MRQLCGEHGESCCFIALCVGSHGQAAGEKKGRKNKAKKKAGKAAKGGALSHMSIRPSLEHGRDLVCGALHGP